jgi:hypothetical protein
MGIQESILQSKEKVSSSIVYFLFILRKFIKGYSPEFTSRIVINIKSRKPQNFNDKILYKMAHDRRPILTKFADKLAVRSYVAEKIGEKYLTKIYADFKDFSEIDLHSLPRNVVFKPNHASGAALIVADFVIPSKSGLRIDPRVFKKYYLHPDSVQKRQLIELGKFWMSNSFYKYHRSRFPEWAYQGIEPKIFAEELLSINERIPEDYRFFIFNGVCTHITVDAPGYEGVTRDIYTRSWEKLAITLHYPNSNQTKPKPANLEEMLGIAEKLGEEIDHIRVDLYELSGRIVFGELTNYHGAGAQKFSPAIFGRDFGKEWHPDTLY